MFTLVAYESTVSNPVIAPITPVQDGTVTVTNFDIRVPVELPNIIAAAGSINSVLAPMRIEITSPSLRSLLPYDLAPFSNTLTWPGPPQLTRMWSTPLPLVGLEGLNALVQNGAAVVNRVLVWFSDGPVKPTTGKIYTVRATGNAALVTATWVNSGVLTFANTLPAGTYQIVGFRAESGNGVAARFFVPGYAWRPGIQCQTGTASNEWYDFRYGNIGVWAEFKHTTPPTIEVLGVTDTAQVFYLDLIKTA
jgi:hypothetical protein